MLPLFIFQILCEFSITLYTKLFKLYKQSYHGYIHTKTKG